MGYYENPPIIEPSRGSEIVSAAIVNAASALSQGMIAAGERRRQEQKERRLTIQKLQDRKNETDLLYNEKMSDWASKQTNTNEAVDKKVRDIVKQKITLAADSQIALLNETDPEKRAQYLKNIRDANGFLDSSASFAKSIAEQTATWRQGVKGASVGVPGGSVVNGKDEDEIIQNTGVLEILGGMTEGYKNTNIEIDQDQNGDGVVMTVTGIDRDGHEIKRVINSKTFGKSEEEGGDGLLVPVESLDPFFTKAKEEIVDKKGNLYSAYISQTRETVDLLSKGDSGGGVGDDQYQIINGQRLQENLIKSKIKAKAEITAAGILKADGPTRLRTLLDYSLGLQPGYYDKQFKTKTPAEQKELLSTLLTEKSWEEMTRSLEKSKGENGETVYWNPTADVRIKDKPSPASLKQEKEEKPEATTYKTEYYDDIINGYTPGANEQVTQAVVDYRTRKNLAENLNRLSGNSGEYMLRQDIFKSWRKSKYKLANGKESKDTWEEAIAKGKLGEGVSVEGEFKRRYGDSEMFINKSGKLIPVKGYDLKTAEGRVKLALDQTSDAGERKILQDKLIDARLTDWMRKNPRKQGESEQAYAARYNKRKRK